MAKDKTSFILYCDLLHTVEKMPKEKAGELFLHILKYVNDQDPQTDDLVVSLTFEPIKQQLKRNLKSWEETRLERSEAGKKGNEKRWGTKKEQHESSQNVAKIANAITPSQTIANVAVSVSDSVSVNVPVNVPVSEENTKNTNVRDEKIPVMKVVKDEQAEVMLYPTFDDFWNAYDKKNDRAPCEKKWAKIPQAEREKILEYLPAYVAATPDKKYRKDPLTFLNKKSWENEINGNYTSKRQADLSYRNPANY